MAALRAVDAEAKDKRTIVVLRELFGVTASSESWFGDDLYGLFSCIDAG
jgi:hypothetical protein